MTTDQARIAFCLRYISSVNLAEEIIALKCCDSRSGQPPGAEGLDRRAVGLLKSQGVTAEQTVAPTAAEY
jgi:hypothetical protein